MNNVGTQVQLRKMRFEVREDQKRHYSQVGYTMGSSSGAFPTERAIVGKPQLCKTDRKRLKQGNGELDGSLTDVGMVGVALLSTY